MPTLLPFRQYDEADVINIYSYSGSIPTNRGTFVKCAFPSGWRSDDTDLSLLGSVGASFVNTNSQRWGTYAAVTSCAATGDYAVGMTLFDVREQDENGQLLKFHPRKAAEMQVVLSGQTVPLATRGLFLWSGTINGPSTAGLKIYPSGTSAITTNAINQNVALGKLLGAPNSSNGAVLIQLNIL
jgi:hypothetical protein